MVENRKERVEGGVTYCDDCKHVYKANKSDSPSRWMCVHHKRLEGFGFVTRTTWDNAPPYLFCKDVNGGLCPLFEPNPGIEKLRQLQE